MTGHFFFCDVDILSATGKILAVVYSMNYSTDSHLSLIGGGPHMTCHHVNRADKNTQLRYHFKLSSSLAVLLEVTFHTFLNRCIIEPRKLCIHCSLLLLQDALWWKLNLWLFFCLSYCRSSSTWGWFLSDLITFYLEVIRMWVFCFHFVVDHVSFTCEFLVMLISIYS